MFEIKTFYSHELKCTNLVVTKTLGQEKTSFLSSPSRFRLEFLIPIHIYCDIDPHLYLVVAMIIVWLQIHNVFLVVALVMTHFFHGSTMYFAWPWSRQLHLAWICSVCFGSYAYLLYLSIYPLALGYFGIGLVVVTSHPPLPLSHTRSCLFHKVFQPSDFSSDLTL